MRECHQKIAQLTSQSDKCIINYIQKRKNNSGTMKRGRKPVVSDREKQKLASYSRLSIKQIKTKACVNATQWTINRVLINTIISKESNIVTQTAEKKICSK